MRFWKSMTNNIRQPKLTPRNITRLSKERTEPFRPCTYTIGGVRIVCKILGVRCTSCCLRESRPYNKSIQCSPFEKPTGTKPSLHHVKVFVVPLLYTTKILRPKFTLEDRLVFMLVRMTMVCIQSNWRTVEK